MNEGYHVIVVGIFYIIAGLLFLRNNRNNIYDKGYGWFLFSFFHGVDEIADGLVRLHIWPNLTFLFDRIEFTTFYLSSSFLLLATLVKINWVKSSEIPYIGFIVQFPVIVYFMSISREMIDIIETKTIMISGIDITFFTIIFGVLPTGILAFAYIYEFTTILMNRFSRTLSGRKSLGLLLVAIMLVLYNVGELFASVTIFFLYLEIIAITVILLTPLELNLGSDNRIQLFMIYHEDGFLLHQLKLNTSLSDDTLILVTGFLSAINTMVEEELQLGALEKIETGNGLLYLIHEAPYIFAMLINAEDPNILERLNRVTEKISPVLRENSDQINQGLPLYLEDEIEQLAMNEFV